MVIAILILLMAVQPTGYSLVIKINCTFTCIFLLAAKFSLNPRLCSLEEAQPLRHTPGARGQRACCSVSYRPSPQENPMGLPHHINPRGTPGSQRRVLVALGGWVPVCTPGARPEAGVRAGPLPAASRVAGPGWTPTALSSANQMLPRWRHRCHHSSSGQDSPQDRGPVHARPLPPLKCPESHGPGVLSICPPPTSLWAGPGPGTELTEPHLRLCRLFPSQALCPARVSSAAVPLLPEENVDPDWSAETDTQHLSGNPGTDASLRPHSHPPPPPSTSHPSLPPPSLLSPSLLPPCTHLPIHPPPCPTPCTLSTRALSP